METQTEYPILSSIRNPNDVKKLSQEQMTELGEEIRRCLVERVSENGGHLASNLGVVELSMAIDRVFDLDRDHVIYDVGHQSYVHKLLSGRFDRFCTLRQPGGISGFPRRDESPYDSFGTGHGSTSLSAALGFAKADKLA
ncbi:MAG: 1-deoxy-D-xylulose-5-phosphate synthase, partial [Clostridia bacterium]|nr:1-deoxy-D-xylulose-5-phosphate synthase [Clostridia bacterium]